MIDVSEQFIQDLVSHLPRLQCMLKRTGRHWAVEANDIVNQEYSFATGRADVVATFGNRTQLVIVEVKGWIADSAALKQLRFYLDNRTGELAEYKNSDVVGLLVAQSFNDIRSEDVPASSNVFLFKLDLSSPGLPFTKVSPEGPMQGVKEDSGPTTLKQSQFVDFRSHHVDYITDEELRNAFCQFANCFLSESDPNREWIYVNPKGEHVAVHYKGEYLICLWARRHKFVAQWGLDGKRHHITRDDWHLHQASYADQIRNLREGIDRSFADRLRDYRLNCESLS